MKRRTIFLIAVSALFLGGVMLFLVHHSAHSSTKQRAFSVNKSAGTNTLAQSTLLATNWPDDPRPAVKALYQFAQVAKIYNFDPHVIYCEKDKTLRYTMIVDTKTHSTEMRTRQGYEICHLFSYLDDSYAPSRDVDLDPAELRKSWADCVGTWNKQEMIEETIRILRDLGYNEYLDIAQKGKFEFKLHEYWAKTPDGRQVTIYPFATVKVLDAHGPRVIAEYRMGTNGRPAGLTHWMAQ